MEEPTTSLFGRRRKRGGRDESATTQRELEVVAELSNAFGRARSPLDVARPLVREVNSLLRVGFAGVVLVDEDGAARLEVAHDVRVVDDLLAHVDGAAVERKSPLDRLDRPFDAGAIAARRGEEDTLHHYAVTLPPAR